MSQAARRTSLTPAEYLAIERKAEFRSEFYKGEMFLMAGGSPQHSLIKANLIRVLGNLLVGGKCRVYDSDLRVRIDATGLYTYPDATIICGDIQYDVNDVKKQTVLNPTLLVEVISPGSEAYDRGKKFDHYQTIATLREYLLIGYESPKVDRFARNDDGTWTLTTRSGLEQTLDLISVPGTLSLNDLYANVEFPSKTTNVDL